MQKRNVLNSPRLLKLKKSRKKATLTKTILFFTGFLVIFILSIYISRLKSLNISTINITGNKVVDSSAIKSEIELDTAGKYLWFFPKTNIFFYPKNYVKEELQSKFKSLKDINLSINNNRVLEVSLTERTPRYTWCGATSPYPDIPTVTLAPTTTTNTTQTENLSLATNEKCYFLNEDGYVFDEAPYFSGEVYFKFYGADGLDISNPLGGYFLSKSFKQLIAFKDILISLGLKPISIYVNGDGEVNVFLYNGDSPTIEPKIIVNIDSDFQNVAENLETALTTDPLQTEFKNKYSTLLYIDLRFTNKVYYKFK